METYGMRMKDQEAQMAIEIKAFLQMNLNRRVTINEIARRFYVSQTSVKRIFKDCYGKSLIKYHTCMKMEKAREELIYTNRTIIQIAGQIGYENASKFSAAFKKIYGESPSVYRRKSKWSGM